MPAFQYQAKRSDGTLEQGVVLGATLDGVAQDLAKKGLNVTQLGFAQDSNDPIPSDFSPRRAPVAEVPRASQPSQPAAAPLREPERPMGDPLPDRSYFQTAVAGPLVGRVPLTDLTFFFRQAATMLKAGVGMVQTMNTLAAQARDPKLATVLREMSNQIAQGHSMSTTLKRYPEVAAGVVVSVLEAGERGGFLDDALETVADYLDQEIELRNLYRRLTFLPKIELAASVVIIIAANAIISAVAVSDKAQKLSSPLTDPATWVVLTPLLIVTFLFFRVGLANPDVKTNWDHFIAKIPYLGTTIRQIAMARFGRAFAALYRSGVPLQTTLVLAANSCGNEYLRSLILPAASKLEQGYGVTDTLEETRAFSPIVIDMVRTGETTGNLDKMLQKTSEFYIDEAKVRQQKLATIVGLVVFLTVAVYIGYIVISFYTGQSAGLAHELPSSGD